MTKEEARLILSDFTGLIGQIFTRFDSKVKDVFVAEKDGQLASHYYEWEVVFKKAFPEHDLLRNNFTIAAILENGKIVGAKSVIVEENLTDFDDLSKKIDYMSPFNEYVPRQNDGGA